MSRRLIYYSLCCTGQPEDQGRLAQLLHSLTSLRRYNRALPVYLHVCGDFNPLLEHYLGQQFGTLTIRFGDYAGLLEAHRPGAAAWLADYPILHKFLSMGHLGRLNPAQVLYVDCDTYFFADPLRLFEASREAAIYAREEPGTATSPLKRHDPDYFSDEAFAALACQLGGRPLAPFHTGVMLLNQGIWNDFYAQAGRFLDYVLGLSRSLQPGQAWPEAIRALPAPCANPWIRDQIAFWLVLSQLPHFTWARLSEAQLLIGAQEAFEPGRYARPVLSHYFSTHTSSFFNALASGAYRED